MSYDADDDDEFGYCMLLKQLKLLKSHTQIIDGSM